jgi:magnesium-transporting ATPase (P-type)
MGFFATLLTTPVRLTGFGRTNSIQVSKKLVESAHADVTSALENLQTTAKGLSQEEVKRRLEEYGTNEVAREKRQSWAMRLWDNVKNPLVILLVILGIISYLTGDLRATIMILLMVLLGIVLRYFQESRADEAAAKLKAMVSTTATVVRDGQRWEIPLQELVPGDIIHLAAGDCEQLLPDRAEEPDDEAILDRENLNDELLVDENYRKIDELPFDFQRRRCR